MGISNMSDVVIEGMQTRCSVNIDWLTLLVQSDMHAAGISNIDCRSDPFIEKLRFGQMLLRYCCCASMVCKMVSALVV
jgi:hypothetical protein